MTEDEKKAMEWLEQCVMQYADSSASDCARTLKAMLARPVMPEEPTIDALIHMDNAIKGPTQYDNMRTAYRALYAHLTAPKTKTVEVWRVEYATQAMGCWGPAIKTCGSAEDAERFRLVREEAGARCIRVIGPIKQEVPA